MSARNRLAAKQVRRAARERRRNPERLAMVATFGGMTDAERGDLAALAGVRLGADPFEVVELVESYFGGTV